MPAIYHFSDAFAPGENVAVLLNRNDAKLFHKGNDQQHIREFWKITYLISGSGQTEINGFLYDIVPGTIFLVHPNDLTTFHLEHDILIYNLLFRDGVLDRFIDTLSDDCGFFQLFRRDVRTSVQQMRPLLHLLDSNREILACLKRMYAEYVAQRSNSDSKLQLMLKEMLIDLSRLSAREFSRRRRKNSAGEIRMYLVENFRNKIDFGEVAKRFGLSRNYFGDFYRANTGETPGRTLEKLRLAEAERLLRKSEFSITEICFKSGFSDFGNFHRIFKRHHGVSPGAWRNSIISS